MAIVINNFEAVAEAPEQQRQKQDSEGENNNQSALPEPQDIALILHILDEQALRSWAH